MFISLSQASIIFIIFITSLLRPIYSIHPLISFDFHYSSMTTLCALSHPLFFSFIEGASFPWPCNIMNLSEWCSISLLLQVIEQTFLPKTCAAYLYMKCYELIIHTIINVLGKRIQTDFNIGYNFNHTKTGTSN